VVVVTTRTRRFEMDIEIEVTDTHRTEPPFVTERICKRLKEKMEELESKYTDFYWYLWEQDSGNGSS
jgi:hypothetical protein